jgi:hypothetical protein
MFMTPQNVLLSLYFKEIMSKCSRIRDILCCNCQTRGVKIRPKECLAKEAYMSCHTLCRLCWKKYRCDNYDSDKEKQKNYPQCYKCMIQSCQNCKNNGGVWKNDIRKVLCYSCI